MTFKDYLNILYGIMSLAEIILTFVSLVLFTRYYYSESILALGWFIIFVVSGGLSMLFMHCFWNGLK